MDCKNGLYYTHNDFLEFYDQFYDIYSKAYPNHVDIDGELLAHVTFVVTEQCNLQCTYCYECHKTEKKMSFETGKKIIDKLLDGNYVDETVQAIVLEFIGGEPLLEIDLIDKLMDYFKIESFKKKSPWFNNYVISITTNGILFNTEKVQKFIKKNKNKLSISITIDGNKKLHDSCRIFKDGSGSYDIVEKSVKNLLSIFPNESTKITLVPQNVDYLCESIENLYNLGYKVFFANPVFENVWENSYKEISLYNQMIKLADYIIDNDLYNKMFISLFDEKYIFLDKRSKKTMKTENYCGGNGRMLAFDTEGKIFPCIRYMQYSLSKQKEQPIGDIDNDFYTIKPAINFYNRIKKISTWSISDNECKKCPFINVCPSCVAYNFDENGDPCKKTKYHCKAMKAIIFANYYYWKKLYAKLKIDKSFEEKVTYEDIC